jgi:hypothetical protein
MREIRCPSKAADMGKEERGETGIEKRSWC